MPPKKRKAAQTEDISSKRAKVQNLAPSEWGSAEDKTNTEKGFPVIPIELTTEILAYFPKIERSTRLIYGDEPVLGWEYLERKDILRALSQTCIAYRSIFLPLLWESFDVCCQSRSMDRPAFYRHAGETLQRKSEGLLNNPHLASYIRSAPSRQRRLIIDTNGNFRIVNVIFTRFKTERVLPPFVECVKIMPNLHTFHILHAHTKMTTALKVAFNDVTLSSILYVNLPGYAHEFLKCCANVKDVECVRDDGSKLVTMIAKNCHSVEKIAGFLPDDKLMKRTSPVVIRDVLSEILLSLSRYRQGNAESSVSPNRVDR